VSGRHCCLALHSQEKSRLDFFISHFCSNLNATHFLNNLNVWFLLLSLSPRLYFSPLVAELICFSPVDSHILNLVDVVPFKHYVIISLNGIKFFAR
jgi:hypothetical protein